MFNREIIGHRAGVHKNTDLVLEAFSSIQVSLKKIILFNTDRGTKFKNDAIDKLLKAFEIIRSLSAKGTSYDNAVSEATYKIFKTEFVNQMTFNTMEGLKLQLADYINWYNSIRLHGSIGYMPPKKN